MEQQGGVFPGVGRGQKRLTRLKIVVIHQCLAKQFVAKGPRQNESNFDTTGKHGWVAGVIRRGFGSVNVRASVIQCGNVVLL